MMTCLLASTNKLRDGPLDAKERHRDRLRGDENGCFVDLVMALPDASATVPVPSGDWWVGVEELAST